MGTAITERLLDAGVKTFVWNRTREKADHLIAQGATWTDRPMAESARVILSLYSSDIVGEVLARWKHDLVGPKILIDTTTGDPQASIGFASALNDQGVAYLEAPISGSSEQTRKGLATLIASGNRQVFDSCIDLWDILGTKRFYVGPSGSAARMKLVTNLVLGLNRAALAEGLALAESMDIDLANALEVLRGSGAYSLQMDTKGGKMIAGDYAAQARLSQHLKDVRLMLQSAEGSGMALPLTEAHRRLLELAESLGLGEHDNSAVFEAIRLRRP
jgi:3-hydroxyisobutyrate dehydrogenase-like beta-hydroxyacid dehydrogenase